MQKRSNFLKKIELKKPRSELNFNDLRQEGNSKHSLEQKNTNLKREDLEGFRFIGIFDKKIIVTYHNELQVFGYFDFHAIHERIRYEYYTLKLRQKILQENIAIPFDQDVIQKEGKEVKNLLGKPKKCLIKIDNSYLNFFQGSKNISIYWGITLEKNSKDEVFIVSSCSILGKNLNIDQMSEILKVGLISLRKKIPAVIDSWVGQFSCKSAYKFNDSFSDAVGKKLIKNLAKCEFPWFCVHGRNTIHISLSSEVGK